MSSAVKSRTPNLGLAILNFGFPNWGDDANNNTKLIDAMSTVLGLSINGPWENDVDYTMGMIAVDMTDSTVWRVEVTHTSAEDGTFLEDRTAHPSYWTEIEANFNVRGEWTTATFYAIGDITYLESEHVVATCVQQHTSSASIRTDEAAGKWVFIVDLKETVDEATTARDEAVEAAENVAGAIAGDIGPAIAASPNKATLVANDKIAITDSENSNVLGHQRYSQHLSQLTTAMNALYAGLVHTHAQSDITGLAAALALLAPKADPIFTGAAQFGGTVTLAGDPASSLQAATKQYVDGLLLNLGKRSTVRVATTANITISTALNAGDAIDGITLVNGDYVLVKNQTAPEENGVYVVGPSPARAPEFDQWAEFPGALISVQEGSTNADTFYTCIANIGGTLGVTALNWSKLIIVGELIASQNLNDVADKPTAFANIKQAATTADSGVVELSTDAEAISETDTARAVTPANLAARRVAFSAHKNGTDQTGVAPNTPTKITFGTEVFDVGSKFSGSTWTPGAGKHVIGATVAQTTNTVSGEQHSLAIRLNGVDHKAATSFATATGIQLHVEALVETDADDTLEIYWTAAGTGNKTITGSTSLTYAYGFKVN